QASKVTLPALVTKNEWISTRRRLTIPPLRTSRMVTARPADMAAIRGASAFAESFRSVTSRCPSLSYASKSLNVPCARVSCRRARRSPRRGGGGGSGRTGSEPVRGDVAGQSQDVTSHGTDQHRVVVSVAGQPRADDLAQVLAP